MIIILASRFDKFAKDLISKWKEHDDALLLTSEDLSRSGWRYWPNNPEQSVAVISDKEIAVKEITGVLTRLPYIYEQELTHIVASDRQYVADEMMAFLVSWLSTLRCPVLNYPSVFCLTGPNWRHEKWLHTAAKIGIPIRPITPVNDKSTSINGGKQDISAIKISHRL